ncbi:hypothetical protein [Roseateles sp.]|uniref:hypothetical protein n=1 Tax=Roseateles sp. TaxID=1971397 RepID=UPI002F421E05
MMRRSSRPRLTVWLSPLIAMAALTAMSAAVAADSSTAPSTADVRWACEQPVVARVRLTSIGLQAPDAPCLASGTDERTNDCRVVVAEASVLDPLPSIGGHPGLERALAASYGRPPSRVTFRFATRDQGPATTPPIELVGVTGLLALPEPPRWGGSKPREWSLGTFLPDTPATSGDLDAVCKPFRHWSGLRSAAMPEQLAGDFPARREGAEALGKRLAALIGPTPPDIAAIERSFGARMVDPGFAYPGRSQTRTLAKLSRQWVRITRDHYDEKSGPPSAILQVDLSGPQAPSRQAPWWERDPTDGWAHPCVTSSMIVDHIGDGWGFSRISLPYRGRFMRSFAQYRVQLEFTPPYYASGPEDGRAPQQECVKTMYIYYSPNSGS